MEVPTLLLTAEFAVKERVWFASSTVALQARLYSVTVLTTVAVCSGHISACCSL